jgi:hypothetical protein
MVRTAGFSAKPNQLSARAFTCVLTDGTRVLSRADEYRRRAQQCLEMAAAFSDRNARVELSHMAQAWLRHHEGP